MNLSYLFPAKAASQRCILAVLGVLALGAAHAASTDIGTAPLFTSSNNSVKPNIMFILDDSGSMGYDYLPVGFSTTKYGRKSSQCNGVAYNPSLVYDLPVNATGTAVAAASLSFITPDPSAQTTNKRNLSAIAAMPASATGTISVTVTDGSRQSNWYAVDKTVTIFQNGDSSRYIVGDVVSWNRTTGVLVLDLGTGGFVQGTGALNPAKIGDGQPKSAKYYKYTGTYPRLSFTYNSSGVITTTNFYQECDSLIGSTPGSSVFTEVTVTSSSAEAQNYANWSVYYSTRMNMMKSGISRAFKAADNRYRIGYSTISETTAVAGTNFLNTADFDATQKSSFYTAFNAASPGGTTPLRGALAKAGQYFAKKAESQTVDPVQYSCQRNFTILSTDGYWNTDDESTTAPKYGPYQLDNTTAVGQQDGSGTLRPMLDGNSITKTTVERWTTTATTITTAATPKATVSTVTNKTTTSTPIAGENHFTFDVLKKASVGNASFQRPASSASCGSTCVVIVTLANHGFVTGDSVVIAGGSVAAYNGTFNVTVISATQFSYTLGSRPANPGGTYTVANAASNSCPAGQGRAVRQFTETRDRLSNSTSTTENTTTTNSVQTVTTTKLDGTPKTRTIIEVDGVVISDSTTAGTLTTSNSSTTTTTSSPPVNSSSGPVVTAGADTFTAWVTTPGSGVLGTPLGTCTATDPADSTATAGTISTAAFSTPAAPVNAGPTTTSGTTVTTVAPSTSADSAKTTTASSTSTGGVQNSLADVAAYYYKTDLRDSGLSNCTGALGSDVCTNNVPGSTANAARSYGDAAAWQHMTTFTLGLGVGGTLNFNTNYLTETSGDFFQITNGSKDWPTPGSSKSAENTDDLWHAAVNGRGQYFSAGDPTSLATSLAGALDSIKAITGSASAASTSSLQPVQGDNDIYLAQFTSVKWIGDVLSYKIDPQNGSISTTPTWSAKSQLDAMATASRKIYYPNPSGAATLRSFTYANLTADAYNANFDNFCTKTGAGGASSPAQCATLSSGDLTLANSGSNLVNYLRGDQTKAYYRARDAVLGDVINASPLYIGKPSFKYTENAYATFAATPRSAAVLVAANDGMLHALDRTTGSELWAYVPSFVIPNLYKLADTSYSNNHSYFVDGSPQMGDIFVSGTGGGWKTIVVGGLNGGGRGYYALDVTDPSAPKLLWEFRNDDLGLSFGNPIITKRADGTWVVVFTSGYNNISPGDGNGHLFVLNANTGAVIMNVSTYTSGTTPAGSSTAPSGLAKLNAWVDTVENNQAKRFYAGDLLGNLWRFDLDSNAQPNQAALRLAELKLNATTPQSITVKPALAEINYSGTRYPVVYVATGRYLGTSDVANTSVQSVYAIKDPLTNAPYGDVRSTSDLVTQTLSVTTNANGVPGRAVSNQPVNWAAKGGWRADFPVGGERTTVNPQIVLNTLNIGTNLPSSDACTVGGESFLYKFDVTTGAAASGTASVGSYVGNVLIQGLTSVQLTNSDGSQGSTENILTTSDGQLKTDINSTPAAAANLRRTSWRELVD
ncbi:pilus assembly protein [Polaromonas sp. YR568]|uniref:pilus assembly protein n=1 Tax=Polaromonas sp. YR568 TaxID=1855301 RepID=UPI00398BC2FB